MYGWLLFLHLAAAFALVTTVVVFSAFALGAEAESRVLTVASVLWAVGGLGTLVFGIWLAIYVNGYQVWDGWIIAAIVLWAGATELGRRADEGFRGREGTTLSQAAVWHWLRSALVLALLVIMVYKPGA